MAINRKNRLTPQDIEDVIACGYPLAQIARESAVDRISLSKFRNHGQALKAADQDALITWLRENDLWDEGGGAMPQAPQQSKGKTLVFPSPLLAVDIGKQVPAAEAERLRARADEVIGNIKRLVARKLSYDDFLIIEADKPDGKSQSEHRQLRDLLAEFSLLQFRMQGNDLAPPPRELLESGARPTTHAELLAQEFPWPGAATEPESEQETEALAV
jgi:hypothetical protein